VKKDRLAKMVASRAALAVRRCPPTPLLHSFTPIRTNLLGIPSKLRSEPASPQVERDRLAKQKDSSKMVSSALARFEVERSEHMVRPGARAQPPR
jgi:hypothetical protein